MSIFKAYDIRGVYPDEINAVLAAKIGRAAARLLPGKTIAVGRDMRASSKELEKAVGLGLLESGKDVVEVGLVSTPMMYFCVGRFGYDGGIMVTASHNPAKYNGFKLSGKGVSPIGADTGLGDIERLVTSGAVDRPPGRERGSFRVAEVLSDYVTHVLSFDKGIKALVVAIDAGNGIGGYTSPRIFEKLPCKLLPLFFELDGTFPHHEPNPLKPENVVDLQKEVKAKGADIGIAIDGDADRAAFVDEQGEVIPGDIITALIAKEILRHEPRAAIIYDVRSSLAVREEIEAAGGRPVICRVGHSYIKQKMRDEQAAFGGELSSHYYFRDNFCADSGDIAIMHVLNILSATGQSLSSLVRPIRRYFQSGEINSEVEDKEGKIGELAGVFSDGIMSRVDGLTVEYPNWWFNVRPSNTEPLLRLNLEAKSREQMEKALSEVLAVIRA